MADNLDTLSKIKAALDAKLIDEAIAAVLRTKVLKLPMVVTVPAAPVATVTAEDPTTRAAKEIRAALACHIGTMDRPSLGKKFHQATFTQPPDEMVRTETAHLLAGTPLKNTLADAFRTTKAGDVPPILAGADEAGKFARLAAREWLIRLIAPYAAWEMSRSNSLVNRSAAAAAVIVQLSDDDAASVGFTLLSNMQKLIKSGGSGSSIVAEQPPLKQGQGNQGQGNQSQGNQGKNQGQGNQGKNQGQNGNNGQNANNNQKRGRDGQNGNNNQKNGNNNQSNNNNQKNNGSAEQSCFFCGGVGHKQKECSVYATACSAAKNS